MSGAGAGLRSPTAASEARRVVMPAGAPPLREVPAEWAPWPLLLGMVVLALPLTRIALAPLALAWNRHR